MYTYTDQMSFIAIKIAVSGPSGGHHTCRSMHSCMYSKVSIHTCCHMHLYLCKEAFACTHVYVHSVDDMHAKTDHCRHIRLSKYHVSGQIITAGYTKIIIDFAVFIWASFFRIRFLIFHRLFEQYPGSYNYLNFP